MKKNNLVKFKDCPVGLFVKEDTLCFKSEYGDDAYIVSSGEYFWGGVATREERAEIMVLPISDKVVQKIERKYGKRMKGGAE